MGNPSSNLQLLLIPSTSRGKAGVAFQCVGLFAIIFLSNDQLSFQERFLNSLSFVLLVVLLPMWVVRAIMLLSGKLKP